MDNVHVQSPVSRFSRKALLYIGLTCLSAVVLVPFFMVASIALTTPDRVFQWPPVLIPTDPQWSNFVDVFRVTNFGRFMWNSFVIASVSTVAIVVIDGLAGYAFAKMRFPGRTKLFILILATLMVPVQVTIVPLFIMFRHFPLAGGNNIFGQGGTGILDSYPALILPFLASAYGTYLMREFMRMLPSNLVDAARMDGAHEFAIFWKIFLPNAKPALAVIAMFNFTAVWNEFMIPLIMTSSSSMKVIQLGLADFSDQVVVRWTLLMAAVLIAVGPLMIMFIIGQRHFVKGVALSGAKG